MFPPLQDDEGREVAIKIDRMDSKKYSADTATKAYVEVHNTELTLSTRTSASQWALKGVG